MDYTDNMNKEMISIKKSAYRTDFLFAKSSFFLGMGSLMGIFHGYYTFNTSKNEAEADRMALESDFATAGRDVYSAVLGA